MRIAYREHRGDLLETVIAPAAAECATTLLSDFKENDDRVDKYWERLKEVRTKRMAMQNVVGETGEMIDAGLPEDGGESSSTVAGLSIYTDRTGVGTTHPMTGSVSALTMGGRKPQRRKKKKSKSLRIRQGTPEEEAALCSHILNMRPTNQTCKEVGELTELLILLEHERDARLLQKSLSDLISKQKSAAEDIHSNPPPFLNLNSLQGRECSTDENYSNREIRWKWDILRPVPEVVDN